MVRLVPRSQKKQYLTIKARREQLVVNETVLPITNPLYNYGASMSSTKLIKSDRGLLAHIFTGLKTVLA